MKKFFADKINNQFIFENEELSHFNVVRCALGEKVLCFDGSNKEYLCEIKEISKKRAVANIIEEKICEKNPKINITVFQGLVKGEKTDLIVQKLTELGISKLVMFESEFAVAKANNNKLDRLYKITKEACKQCGRSIPLEIAEMVKFKDMLEQLKDYDLICFANEKNGDRLNEILPKSKNIAIIIGSEGGFSDNEIEKIYAVGAVNFGLGSRILRAETACIAISSVIGYMVGV